MVDFGQIRKQLLQAEGDDDEGDSILSGVTIPVAGWRKELDNFPTAGSLSLGVGLLGAMVFDAIKNRGDEGNPIFMQPWKDMVLLIGSLSLGYGVGRLSRGKVAQHEAEHYESIIEAAEEEERLEAEAEDEASNKRAEDAQRTLNFLADPSTLGNSDLMGFSSPYF
mgnify:CR=1 FL=1